MSLIGFNLNMRDIREGQVTQASKQKPSGAIFVKYRL